MLIDNIQHHCDTLGKLILIILKLLPPLNELVCCSLVTLLEGVHRFVSSHGSSQGISFETEFNQHGVVRILVSCHKMLPPSTFPAHAVDWAHGLLVPFEGVVGPLQALRIRRKPDNHSLVEAGEGIPNRRRPFRERLAAYRALLRESPSQRTSNSTVQSPVSIE